MSATEEQIVVDGETGEIVEMAGAMPALRADTSTALIRSESPAELIERATEVATVLADVVERQKLYSIIRGKKHVQIEGWTTLGSLMGTFGQAVFAITDWSRPIVDEAGQRIGWEARAHAKTIEGAIVGGAEAQCLRSEDNWRDSDDYALRSMAQTRAASKALRMPLGFVMRLAGYETTPLEEMPIEGEAKRRPKAATKKDVDKLRDLLTAEGTTDEVIDSNFEQRKVDGVLPADYVRRQIAYAEERLAEANALAEAAAVAAADPENDVPF